MSGTTGPETTCPKTPCPKTPRPEAAGAPTAPTFGRGRLIAVEGLDGSGKSSLVHALAAELTRNGYPVLTTAEPGGTEGGRALRHLLLTTTGPGWSPMAELLLMTAARVEHAAQVIRPALAQGRVVLCDRFVGSTLAYQGGGRRLPVEQILTLHALALGDLWPDFTLLLDLDVPTALARSHRRLAAGTVDEGRFEAADPAFHQRVRDSFLAQAAAAPDRHGVIPSAGLTPDQVVDRAAALLRPVLVSQGAET